MPAPARYTQHQLIAHWLIVFLVFMQFLLNGQMSQSYETGVEQGVLPVTGGVISHATGGSLILLVMLWRVTLRLRHKAPPPPETEARPLQWLSRGTHFAFYALLLAMPIAGWLAITTLQPIWGELHEIAALVLLVLIVLHFAGAMAHLLFWKDEAGKRMFRARRAETPFRDPGRS